MMYEYDDYLRYCEEIGVCEKPETLKENKPEEPKGEQHGILNEGS